MNTEYVQSSEEAAAVADVRQGYVATYADKLVEWAEITPVSTHVDLPCGAGDMLQRIREKGGIGLAYLADINSSMLEAAERAVPERAMYVQTDGAHVGSAIPKGVDSISCLNGFHIYIEGKDQFLAGCFDILKPGGRLVLDVSTMGLNHDSRRFLDRHDELMREGAVRLGTEAHLPPYADQTTLDAYSDMAARHGFTLVAKHFFEVINDIAKFESDTTKIPGRLRSRFPELEDKARLQFFMDASKQAQEETGLAKVKHSRVFYVLEKPEV
jgi:ubiquinone/menaquinone biosynthesis C-methylase UbiE